MHALNVFYAASLYQPRKLLLKRRQLKQRRRKRQRVCCLISRSSLFVSLRGFCARFKCILRCVTLSAKKAALEKTAADAKAAEEAAGMLPHLTICLCLCH